MMDVLLCRANDAPYGRFTIVEPSIVVDQTVFSQISRSFLYTIARENGLIGDVLLNVVTTYNPVSIYIYQLYTQFYTLYHVYRIPQLSMWKSFQQSCRMVDSSNKWCCLLHLVLT